MFTYKRNEYLFWLQPIVFSASIFFFFAFEFRSRKYFWTVQWFSCVVVLRACATFSGKCHSFNSSTEQIRGKRSACKKNREIKRFSSFGYVWLPFRYLCLSRLLGKPHNVMEPQLKIAVDEFQLFSIFNSTFQFLRYDIFSRAIFFPRLF